jgi:hypothetical protein
MIRGFRILFLGSFENHFDVGFPHGLFQAPMHDESTVSIQDAAQIVERTAHVDIGNIDMPVLMRLLGAARNPSPCATAYFSTAIAVQLALGLAKR